MTFVTRLIAASILLVWFAAALGAEAPSGPITPGARYTGEFLGNRSGGLRQDSAYVDNFDLTLKFDTGRLLGWSGSELFVYGLYNNGTPFSETIVGDLQVVSNIETGVEAVRLYEAWFRFPVGQRSEFLIGLYDLNSEFDVLDISTLFIGSAHGIGTDISQAGLNGPSIFPVTGLSVRYERQWNDRWTFRGAVLDGVPGDPENPGDTAIQLSSDEGALLIGEFERSTDLSRVLIGAWGYSAQFDTDPLGLNVPTSGERRGNSGAYLRGERVVYDDASTLAVFGRAGYANGNFNIFDYFLSAGVTWRGMLRQRYDDTLGLAIAWAMTSDELDDRATLAGRDIEPAEGIVELTYRAPINDRIVLQPSVHYVINPGLEPSRDNALVVGLRMELSLLN